MNIPGNSSSFTPSSFRALRQVNEATFKDVSLGLTQISKLERKGDECSSKDANL